MSNIVSKKENAFLSFIKGVSGTKTLEAEKSRLEAFLSAVPGDYCGWSPDGSVAYSPGFCALLGIAHVDTIADIQNALSISDSASLEGVFTRLKQDAIPFTIIVKDKMEKRTLRIAGNRGTAIDSSDYFNILWIEDVTRQTQAQNSLNADMEKHQEQLERMRLSLNQFPWPLWMRGEKQKITWCNKAYADFLGLEIAEILKEKKELVPPTRKKKTDAVSGSPPGPELALKAIRSGIQQETRAHVIHGGKRLLMRIYETPLKESQMTVGFAEDITEQEELENTLKRYHATNEELLEQLRTAIGIFGPDHKLEFYNTAFAQLWTLEDQYLNNRPTLGDLMEKLRAERRLPEQADFRRFKKSWLDMFTSLIDPHEDMLYLPDGSALRMLVVPQGSGGLMMTFEDVTSRLELESSYNTLIAVQKETLDNLGEGVAVYGGDGRLKLWNPSFGRLWKLNPEDLEGEPHINSLVGKMKGFFDPKEWEERREELISKGLDRIMHEGRIRLNNGTHMDYITVPLPDGGVLVTYIDVTDTVRVENALREKNAALEAAEQLKMDFLANVSYQLRTPLNAIIGFNDILRQEYFGPLNERQKTYTHDISAASERLVNLINDILDLSTIEAGYLSLDKTPVKIYDMLHGLTDLISEWARKTKIEIVLSCPKNIGSIEADERRLKQAIINLIRNSIAFTPVGGEISLSGKRRKDGVEITVSDTGIGIDRESQIRIFQPFEKAQKGHSEPQKSSNSLKEKHAGAGLGLSLVKNIVALHGGSVTLQSEPGKGTQVTLFFPFEAKEETGSAENTQSIKMKKALSFKQ